jgi:acyloxyacyl hydrolase
MTTPEDFKAAIIELWDKLDTIVPKGSHMVVTGVADGRILYECL